MMMRRLPVVGLIGPYQMIGDDVVVDDDDVGLVLVQWTWTLPARSSDHQPWKEERQKGRPPSGRMLPSLML